MRKWFSLPTWLLTRMMLRFMRADHPWKRRPWFSLQEWCDGSTKITRQFDWTFWWVFVLLLVMAGRLLYG